MQMQGFSRSYPFRVPQELGSHTETGKATICHKPERQIFLLEEIRVRDLQANVSIHLQDWSKNLQDYRFNQ